MSKKLFSEKEINSLTKNQYIAKVSAKIITYINVFKIHFIAEISKGKTFIQIFEEAGLPLEILGERRIHTAATRWKKAFAKEGVAGLNDTRKGNSGKPLQRELTKDEIIERLESKLKYIEAENEFLKKLELQERQVGSNKLFAAEKFKLIFETITKLKLKNMVSYLCDIVEVSRSGYYNHLKVKDSNDLKEVKDLVAKENIMKAYHFKKAKKGSHSIKMTLENEFGVLYNRKKIQRIMRKYAILCPIRKSNPYKRIAKATKKHRVVPNLLQRFFKQEKPGKVLLTDITYLKLANGNFAYLSTVKDGSTNEILSYHLSNRITLDIALETIKKLVNNPNVKLAADAFVHSDQGVHYTSPIFQNLLKKYGLKQSMSRRGNCWDNAPQESFFGHMKDKMEFKDCNSIEEL